MLSLQSAWAADTPDSAEVDAAVQRACDLLVANQEIYEPDPAVGTLPEDKLKGWQAKEIARLADLRKKAGENGQEWPYEGVYRVRPDGRIPPGYRVGGTAIVCGALLDAPKLDDERRAAIHRGVDFMLRLIHEDPDMAAKKQTSYDVRGWGQAYALKFFLRGLAVKLFEGDERDRVRKTIPHLIHCLHEGATTNS